jgi:hypothetical protein
MSKQDFFLFLFVLTIILSILAIEYLVKLLLPDHIAKYLTAEAVFAIASLLFLIGMIVLSRIFSKRKEKNPKKDTDK